MSKYEKWLDEEGTDADPDYEEPRGSSASSSNGLLCCSFCGKPNCEVKGMIAGPNANICTDCAYTCVGILLGCVEKNAT